NATVSFSVPQALAVAERVERALARRREAGLGNEGINPVCTIMVGRLDDWLKHVAARDGAELDPAALNYAGVACAKKAYALYREKAYRTRLLIAAFRLPCHWTEFIGGDLSLTIPHKYQTEFNNAHIEVTAHIQEPVSAAYLKDLERLPDFRKAYGDMTVEEFDGFGPVNKTLEQFAQGYDDLVRIVRSFQFQY
ncbi:MAG: transaldolase family protein, partial [Bacillota bacterium]|nr:transaldolase family protein [Bacillota bacterium]